MNKGSIVERLCSDLDRKEPRYKSPTLLYFTLLSILLNTYKGMENIRTGIPLIPGSPGGPTFP